MNEKRYVVECVWSGYRASQSCPCHRMVETRRRAKRLTKISTVAFTDGTTMSVAVRPALPRERVKEINGYNQLLDDILSVGLEGFVTIEGVNKAKAERTARVLAIANRSKPATAPQGMEVDF